MNARSELITVFKRKIENFQADIKGLDAQSALLDEQLEEEHEQREELDKEVIQLTRKIGLLENDLDDTERRLLEAKVKWQELNVVAEECERSRKQLQSQHDMDDDRIYQLELLVKEATDQANEAEARYEEMARKLISAENTLESLENEYEKAEKQLKEVTSEYNSVFGSLKILEQNELKAADKERTYDSTCKSLKKQLQEAEKRTQVADVELMKHQTMLDELEDAFDAEKRNHMLLENDRQRMVDEFQHL